jgi:hypothetical protein
MRRSSPPNPRAALFDRELALVRRIRSAAAQARGNMFHYTGD